MATKKEETKGGQKEGKSLQGIQLQQCSFFYPASILYTSFSSILLTSVSGQVSLEMAKAAGADMTDAPSR